MPDQTKTVTMKQASALMQHAVKDGIFPGGILLVGCKGRVIFHEPFGCADLRTRAAVTHDTIFDLASLTKPLATTLALIRLTMAIPQLLTTPIADIFGIDGASGNAPVGAATPAHLLSHTSGLPAYHPFYRLLAGIPCSGRKRWLQTALLTMPLVSPIGQRTIYSDLGFLLLQLIVEKQTGTPLDRFVQTEIYQPLNIPDIRYMRPETPKAGNVAATERCPWRNRMLNGDVHDENAFALGGVAGHAGLFGTGTAVYRVVQSIAGAYHGTDAAASGVLAPEVVRRFLSPYRNSGRSLGFDRPSAGNSSAGTCFSDATVGHLGFTGTSFWIDLKRRIVVVLLTNRVHPSRRNQRIRKFRPALHDAVMTQLVSKKDGSVSDLY